jgi:hypothetical protein
MLVLRPITFIGIMKKNRSHRYQLPLPLTQIEVQTPHIVTEFLRLMLQITSPKKAMRDVIRPRLLQQYPVWSLITPSIAMGMMQVEMGIMGKSMGQH